MKIHGTDARIEFDGVVPFISGDNKATSDESLYGFEKLHSCSFKEISQAVKEEPDSVHYAIN